MNSTVSAGKNASTRLWHGARGLLSIIVVSYNTIDLTVNCLHSIFQETSADTFEIIVVDNASSDGSAEAIEREFGSRIRLISLSENIGFAAANNHAVQFTSGELLLLINPDTVVLNRAIERLVAFSHLSPSAGIWGGRTVFADGTLNPASCWARQTFWSLFCQATGLNSLCRRSSWFNPEAMGAWKRDAQREVDIISGCFLLIRRSLWMQLEGFRREFFMYGEEADLCLRARQLGARPVITPNATIVHYGGASEKIRADKLVRLLRAKTLLIELHFSCGAKRLGRSLLALWPLSRFLANALLAAAGRNLAKEKAEIWREVLDRRPDWDISVNDSCYLRK